MKKIYTLIATVAVVFSANAQRTASTSTSPVTTQAYGTINAERAPFDTLWWANAASTPTLYNSTGGGYVCGNNGYGDKAKAQAFINSFGSIAVTGTLVWFGAKSGAGAGTSKVVIQEYSMNGTGTNVGGTGAAAPGTVNGSIDLLHSAIDTTSATAITAYMFPTAIATSADFAVGVDFTTLAAGDTAGLVSNADLEPGGTDLSWDKWSDNSWHSLLEPGNWGLDIELAMWPIIDLGSGIGEGFINGVLAQNSPNPAVNSTTITYSLEKDANNVSIKIIDAAGKTVRTYNEGNKAAGKYSINVETASLEAGVYYYALTAGKGRIASKMVVTK
jgi:hypothetical protein